MTLQLFLDILCAALAVWLLWMAIDVLTQRMHEREVKRKREADWTRMRKWIEADNSEFARAQRRIRGEE